MLDNVLLGRAVPALVLYRQSRTYTVPLVPAVVALVQGGLIDGGRPALGSGLFAGFAPVNV